MTIKIDPRIGRRQTLALALAAWIWPLAAVRANLADADAAAGPAAPVAALGANPARRAVAPVTPTLPAEVVAQLQGGQFAEAIAALDPLIADPQASPSDRAFFRLVRGGAARLADRPDDARATWTAAIEADPTGVWVNKLRGELAALELATGHPDRAEVLARTEAQSLLAPDRKDRLAEVYRDFARRLLEPEFPGASDDPVAAYALLAKGRDLAKGPALRASLLFAMGRAGQDVSAGRDSEPANPARQDPSRTAVRRVPPDPIRDYNDYLKEYPQGADRDQVRFHLGEVLLAIGQAVEARLTWTDLARDLARRPDVEPDKHRQALRGQALYGIARTYGMPSPGDQRHLNLGVAALQRFLREAPADPKAPLAAFEIGQAYLNQGQADPAIAALQVVPPRGRIPGRDRRGAADPRRPGDAGDLSDRPGDARPGALPRGDRGLRGVPEPVSQRVGVGRRPAGDPRRAVRRRSGCDDREKFDDARAAWLKFAEVNPLDGRVPAALFLAGQTFASEKKWDEAIAAWDTLAARFAATPRGRARPVRGRGARRDREGRPRRRDRAVPQGRRPDPWAAQANQRIADHGGQRLDRRHPADVSVGRNRPAQDHDAEPRQPDLLGLQAQPRGVLSQEALARRRRRARHRPGRPRLRVDGARPGYAKFKPVEANFDLKVAVPGVYVVKVSDEKTLQASAW